MFISHEDWTHFIEAVSADPTLSMGVAIGKGGAVWEVLQARLSELDHALTIDYRLLKRYEDARRLEGAPQQQRRQEEAIADLRASIKRYREAYQALLGQLAALSPQTPRVTSLTSRIETKLNLIQQTFEQDWMAAHEAVVQHYEARHQDFIVDITEHLDAQQLATLQLIFVALEANRLSLTEMSQTIMMVQQGMALLPQLSPALLDSAQLAEVIASPHLDVRHKFELALPAIPFFLEYQGEVEVGRGVKLESCWNWLVSRAQGSGQR